MDEQVREELARRVREMQLRVIEMAMGRAEVDFATGVLGTTARRIREAIELCRALDELELRLRLEPQPLPPRDVNGMTRV